MSEFDAIIIGAGHNALICAGYLARAGYSVCVLERRSVIGGAVVTEEHVPGFKFDLGGSAHILINHTPIVDELSLAEYGLDYLDVDPLFFAPFPDGSHIMFHRDVTATCDSIAAVSPEDAENYRRFIDDWRPLAHAMVEAFLQRPSPFNLVRTLGIRSGFGRDSMERLADILRGYGPLLRQTFRSPKVQAAVGWMAAQSGPPPTEPLSAPFALWHPMYHESGIRRPRGGSGMLTQALGRMIEAHGGTIITNAPVARIMVEHGRAVGAETEDGRLFTGKLVISGTHVHTTLKMLTTGDIPDRADRLLRKARVGNGFGMIVRYALSELPDYTALPSARAGAPGPQHRALQFICPSLDYLDRAYGDYLARRPSEDPALVAMTFSAVDPSLAPAGKHTLFLWGQYFPYELASGENWDDIGPRIADGMLSKLAEYAPNVKGAVIGELVETPLYLERTLGLLRGNVMHLEMSLDQMFMMRPALTMGNYRGPIKGLYFTGASTHPGGGIMGAAGRNAASVVLHDLSRSRWRFWRRN